MRNLLLAITLSLGMVSTMPLAVYGQRLSVGDLDKLDIVTTASELSTARCQDGGQVTTLGRSSVTDDGGDTYVYDADSTATIDGGFVMPGRGGTLSFDASGTFDGTAGTGRFIAVDQSVIYAAKWGATTDGSDNLSAFRRMVARSSADKVWIELAAGEYVLSDQVTVLDGTKIRGQGMRTTKILCQNQNVDVFDLENVQNATFSHMEITEEATPDDTTSGGAFRSGTGNGTLAADPTSEIEFDHLYLHDFGSQSCLFQTGVQNFNVHDCEIDRCGRSGLTFSGIQRLRFHNNIVGSTGDDGVAVNNVSGEAVISGCLFRNCGTHDTTQPGGIKIHGSGVVATGNHFEGCVSALYVKAHPDYEDDSNGSSVARKVVFSSNVVRNLAPDGGIYGDPVGIRVEHGMVVSLRDNIVCAIGADGTQWIPLEFETGHKISSSGNTYIGSVIRFIQPGRPIGEVSFFNDTFFCGLGNGNSSDDYRLFQTIGNSPIAQIKLTRCGISSLCTTILKTFAGDTIGELILDDCEIVSPLPHCTLSADVDNGVATTSLSIFTSSADYYDRPAFDHNIDDGSKMNICTYENGSIVREEVTLNAAYTKGDTSITIASFTPSRDYVSGDSWLERANDYGSKALINFNSTATVGSLKVYGRHERGLEDYSTRNGSGSGTLSSSQLDSIVVLPTSDAGLPSGAIWNNGGSIAIVP